MAYSTRNISDNISEVGETIGRRVHDLAGNLNPAAREYMERGREYGEQAQTMARSAVRARPLTVIMVAVAFGFALGSVWR